MHVPLITGKCRHCFNQTFQCFGFIMFVVSVNNFYAALIRDGMAAEFCLVPLINDQATVPAAQAT